MAAIRDEKGRFKKGSVANPAGRPPTGLAWNERFEDAIKAWEKKKKQKFADALLAMAFREPSVMNKLLDKLAPSRKPVNGDNGEDNTIEAALKKFSDKLPG